MGYVIWGIHICQTGAERIYYSKLEAVLIFVILLVSLLVFQIFTRIKFKNKQLEYSRVSEAMKEKRQFIKEYFKVKGVSFPPRRVFIRVFKEDKAMELWASSKRRGPFTFIKNYEISCLSGSLGPKSQDGDKQVPEGFYYIDRFNPLSKFYLSLGLSYPNESDCILGVRQNLGGDIFIHGGSSTVGCIPITDDKIKELYLIAVEAVSNGQDKIQVHIFPKRLDEQGLKDLKERFENNQGLLVFWDNLKEGFDRFEQTRRLPKITVGRNGRYIFR